MEYLKQFIFYFILADTNTLNNLNSASKNLKNALDKLCPFTKCLINKNDKYGKIVLIYKSSYIQNFRINLSGGPYTKINYDSCNSHLT